MSPFPSYPEVGILRFVDSGFAGTAKIISITNLRPFFFIQKSLSRTVHRVDVITYLTVAGAYLQVIEPLSRTGHKFFIAYAPSERYSREKAKAFALKEVFRTVVTGIKLGQISVIVAVSNTSYQSLFAIRKDYAAQLIFLLHVQ
ncbi:hypothetical protein SDC9_118904 [bioreactor metagenome]|uniref:Uncharacterized protein n=1 Tax=bioreactor metagenome TaxID=1076179 RepID=A0A645C2Q9_9ZZZZ